MNNTSLCLEENLLLDNTSANSVEYLWDFCFESLSSTPDFTSLGSLGITTVEGLELAYDEGTWYGFTSNRNTGILTRLVFGDSLTGSPNVETVTLSGDAISNLTEIRLVEEGGTWYAIGIGYSTELIYRFTFGSGLSGVASVENLGSFGTWKNLRGMDLVQAGSDWILSVSSDQTDEVTLVKFGGGITATPTETVTISNADLDGPRGMGYIEESGNWYGLLASFGSDKVFLMDFGSDLFSVPAMTEIATPTNPSDVELVKEGNQYYGLILTRDNGLERISFGTSIADGTGDIYDAIGNFSNGIFENFGARLVQDSTIWRLLTVDFFGTLSRIDFLESCTGITPVSSTDFEPTVSYSAAGDYAVELIAIGSNGNEDRFQGSVTVNSSSAPDISFSTSNMCLSSSNSFSITNVSGDITSYSWDFDNDGMEDSNLAEPTVDLFTDYGLGAGSHLIRLVVDNGSCTNESTQSVTLYNEPVSAFMAPISNLCTNTSLTFTNASTYDVGSPVTWSWDLDGDGMEDSTDESPSFTYATSGVYTVSLTVSLADGCEDTSSTMITLADGPLASFSWTNNCFGEAVTFVNESASGDYTWDFGDGSGLDMSTNPNHTYALAGDYDVILTVDDGSCETTVTETLTVNDQPLVSFSTSTPLEENVGIDFGGEDLTLSGDLVEGWSWDFDGLGSSSAEDTSFAFSTPGTYDVSLSVTTSQGCTDTAIQSLTIEASERPTASFSLGSTEVCLAEALSIENTSVNAESYLWDFCFESLSSTPEFTSVGSLGITTVEGLELAYDEGTWYGFTSNRDEAELIRMVFGDSLTGSPAVDTVSLTGDAISNLTEIRLVEEGGTWYAIGIGYSTELIYRFTFGSGLSGAASVENLGSFGTWNNLRGMDLVQAGSDWILSVSSDQTADVTLIKFDGGITATPTETVTITDADLIQPRGMGYIEESGNWYGLLASFGSDKVFLMDFGSDLFSVPAMTEIATPTNPSDVELVKEGNQYYGLILTRDNGLERISFGTSIADGTGDIYDAIGNFSNGIFENFGARLVQDSTIWRLLTVDFFGTLSRIDFLESCTGITPLSSTDFEPTVSYSAAGDYAVELIAIGSNGNEDRFQGSVTVNSSSAPDISFSTSNMCLSSSNSFSITNVSGDITSYSWDFDNDGMEDSNLAEPTVDLFTDYGLGAGSHLIRLVVDNGSCTNESTQSVTLYNEPVSAFMAPMSNLCTNTSLTFTNASTYDVGSPVTWSWDLDGDGMEDSTDESPSFTYATSGVYTVSLTVSLADGCEDTSSTMITLADGPLASFSWTNNCFGEAVTFVNESASGDYTWDFGDGSGLDMSTNPNHTYALAGDYDVILTVDDGSCETTVTETLTVNDQPLVSFSTSTPLEENVGIDFGGEDLTLSGDLVEGWSWDFDGLGSSSAEDTSFAFSTPGTYDVSLSVTTSQGCTDTAIQSLTIEASERPTASFSLGSTEVCLAEALSIENTSVNAESYLWDFCFESLSSTPEFTSVGSLGITTVEGLELAYDEGTWYGFTSNRDEAELIRMVFGDSLTGSPAVDTVSLTGDAISNLTEIRLVEEGGTWYAIGIGYSTELIYRFTFGSGLSGAASVENLGSFGTWNNLRGMDLVQAGSDWILSVSSDQTADVTLIKFDGGITATPTETVTITDADLIQPRGMGYIEESGNWYGLLASFGSDKVFLMDFGSDLFSVPAMTEIATPTNPSDVELVKEGNQYYGLILTRDNGLERISFGTSIADGTGDIYDAIGNFSNGIFENFGARLVQDSTIWRLLTVDFFGTLSRIDFLESCTGITPLSSTDFEPTVSYSAAGDYAVELIAIGSNGNEDRFQGSVTVNSSSAPDISFSTSNMCLSSSNSFSITNVSGDITSYSWDFDNDGMEDSNLAEPTVDLFTDYGLGAGSHLIRLVVDNGSCTNESTQSVTLYNEPVSAFMAPMSNLCTNTSLTFTNASTYDVGSPVTWSWDLDGDGMEDSTDESPSFTYATSGVYTVSLTVSLADGCEDTSSTMITLADGPLASFSWTNNCFGEAVTFVNESASGDYTWDFGDGSGLDMSTNPNHTYALAGDYDVILTVDDGSCETTVTETLTVNDQPLVSFSTSTPLEENVGIDFDGEDLTLSGDLVEGWSWDFDGLGSSSAEDTSFAFSTPGTYDVSLSVTTSQGCTDTAIQSLTIEASERPTASFSLGSTEVCLAEALSIENTSVNAESYLWDFCFESLSSTPEFTSVGSLGITTVEGLELAYDEGTWYGFTSNRDEAELIRMVFGDSLTGSPAVDTVSLTGDAIANLTEIRLVEEGGTWYAIGIGYSTELIYRFTFGSGLSGSASVENLGSFGTWNNLRGMDLVEAGSDWILSVSSDQTDEVTLVKFGGGITATPAETVTITDADLDGPRGMGYIQESGNWYGLLTSFGSDKVFLMDFGSDLFSVPTMTEIATPTNPSDVELVKEGNQYYGLILTRDNGLERISFGTSISDGTGDVYDAIGNFSNGIFENFGARLVQDSTIWRLLTVDFFGTLSRIDFLESCTGITPLSSTDFEPTVSYSAAGDYAVELIATGSNGNESRSLSAITVTSDTAPFISFTSTDSRCILNANQFSATPSTGLSYSWDFNGEGTANSSFETFQFPTTGEKRVVLTVSDGICTNQAVEVFDIYPEPPDPVFIFDEAQYCAEVDFEVNNMTDETGFNGNLDYEWIVQADSDFVFMGSDPAFNVAPIGTFTVTARSSVPGCESEVVSGSVTIEDSPDTDFSFTPTCEGEITTFTNLTEDAVSQIWNFGNNFTSTQFSPEHFYDSAATYAVSLTAVNDLGCAKTVTDTITVGSLPLPGFQVTQGCEGAVALEDTSTVIGADIAEWAWSIENELFSSDQNPIQDISEPGLYLIRQRVTSSTGCEAELLRQITIFDAAEVDFETITACNGSPFTFTDVSTTLNNNPIVARSWSINGTQYDDETIQHTFPAPGAYEATLVLTNQNLCTATRTETVIVPDIPTLDFPEASGCQHEFLTINDESMVGNDTIISRSWFLNGQVIGSGSTLLHRFDNDGINEVTLSVTTQQGCLYEHTEEISIFPAATAGFESSTTFGVEGTSITFDNNSTLASSFVWTVDGDSITNSEDFNFRFDESGDYEVALVAVSDFSCTDTLQQDIRIRMPEVDLVIREVLLQEEDDEFSTIVVSLQNRSNLPVADVGFTITVDDQLPTRDRVQEVVGIGETRVFQLSTSVPNRARYICLEVSSDYDVDDNAPADNEVCLNIEPTVVFEEPRPNPARDQTVVRTVLPESGSVRLSLVSVSGKTEIMETYPDLAPGLQAFTIQLQDLDAGLYVLRIEYNGKIDTKRIIKR